jgi:4-aminobutyrate aminotransferase-like enzyme
MNQSTIEPISMTKIATTKRKINGLSEGSTISSDELVIESASGVFLQDIHNKKYLDLFSQTWSLPLGHNNERVRKAVMDQLDKATHLRTAYSTKYKSELAQRITELAPVGLTNVNFALHGSLAVEGAMKLAINNYQDRHKILFLEDGFHGRSFATMGVSWRIADCKYGPYFSNGIEARKDLGDIELKMLTEKPAAIILELVQGNAGCKILDKELVQGIRKLCDQNDVVMIIDEVQTAFGCMGKMFLCEDYGVIPDILVFGKAIGGGFPLAGSIYKDKYHLQSGEHSFTFGHFPLSMAAGTAYLKELQKVLRKNPVPQISRQIKESLERIEKDYLIFSNARCIGTKGAIDVHDLEGRPDPKTADLIVSKMQQKGVIIANSKFRGLGSTLMLQPPIIITPRQLASAFCILAEVIDDITGAL